jgi:hypothetical protein
MLAPSERSLPFCSACTMRSRNHAKASARRDSQTWIVSFPITCQQVIPACRAPLFFYPAFLLADGLMPESLPCCSQIC